MALTTQRDGNVSQGYFLAIAGNIGVGKTELTNRLSDELGWVAYYEPVIQNPYLDPFYENMTRWSFHLQIYFLSERFKAQVEIGKSSAALHPGPHHLRGRRDLRAHAARAGLDDRRGLRELRRRCSGVLVSFLRKPDLILYLKADPEVADGAHRAARARERAGASRIDYIAAAEPRLRRLDAARAGRGRGARDRHRPRAAAGRDRRRSGSWSTTSSAAIRAGASCTWTARADAQPPPRRRAATAVAAPQAPRRWSAQRCRAAAARVRLRSVDRGIRPVGPAALALGEARCVRPRPRSRGSSRPRRRRTVATIRNAGQLVADRVRAARARPRGRRVSVTSASAVVASCLRRAQRLDRGVHRVAHREQERPTPRSRGRWRSPLRPVARGGRSPHSASSPGWCCHTSSAVNASAGEAAIVRSCSACHSTVCAERRAGIVGRQRVEPVLGDVEEHRRQVHRAQVEQPVERRGGTGTAASRARMRSRRAARWSGERPVDARSGARAAARRAGVEVAQVAEQEAERVPHLAIGVRDALQDLVADAHVAAPVGGERPPAHDVGAVLRRSPVIGRDHVAERLVHRAALRVEHPAVGQHVGVGRAAVSADAHHERGVEPAAVLVGALEVDDPAALARRRAASARRSSGCVTWIARCVEPESNHTSRMSVSLRNGPAAPQFGQVKPGGQEVARPAARTRRPSRARG